ncbi:MAG: hypothetical protein K0R27_1709 [Xanthobacteraceae bacterium]|jgi:hypothetical protein|nr:hypothetical protein [Xanthobacteraceae bacterium]
MSVDLIRYDLLVQDALRDVVRRVLTDAARDGLPGEHHFFIGFNTQAPGVRLSARLKERHPTTMTIVLQHQFWDLVVTDKFIEVGLSFGNVPERLHIPFEALTSFYDPSVKFGLQFEPQAEGDDEDVGAEASPPAAPERPARSRTTSVPATSTTRTPEPAPAKPAALKSVPAKPVEAKSAEPKPAERTKAPEPAAKPTAKDGAKEAARDTAAKDTAAKDASAKDTPAKDVPAKDVPAKDETTSGGAQVVRLDAFRKK